MGREKQGGRGGMGNHKHGTSGTPGKSPKARHAMKREAEKNDRKAKPTTCTASSVGELLSSRHDK